MPILYKNLGGELCDYPKADIQREIAKQLIRLWQYADAGMPNDIQLQDTVNDILATYPDMGVAEVKLSIQRLRTGYYGKLYGKVTPFVVMDAIRATYEEGQNHRADVRESKHAALKRQEFNTPILDAFVSHEKISDFIRQREEAEQVLKEAKREKERQDRAAWDAQRKSMQIEWQKREDERLQSNG